MFINYEFYVILLTSYGECCNYFKNKCIEWESKEPDHDIKKYVEIKGKNGLTAEFKTDYIFKNVICPFLKDYAQGKEKDVTESIVKDALSILEGNLLQTQINIIISAVLLACGFSDDAHTLLKIALGGLIVAGLIGAVASLKK